MTMEIHIYFLQVTVKNVQSGQINRCVTNIMAVLGGVTTVIAGASAMVSYLIFYFLSHFTV